MKFATLALGLGLFTSAFFVKPATASAYNFLNSAQKLLVISNDRDASLTRIDFLTDSAANGVGISYVQDGNNADYSLEQVKGGAVLEAQQGINALTVKGSINPQSGGTLNFIYIANGLMNQYKTCSAIIRRNGNGEWQMFNSTTHARIETVKFITWQFGISTIQGLCNN